MSLAPPTIAAPWPPSPAGPPRPSRRARPLLPLLLTAYLAIVAFLPAFTLPADLAPSGDDTVVHMWDLFRWFPDEPAGEKTATAAQLLALAVALLALAASRGPALRALAYPGVLLAAGLEVFTGLHYGGPWTLDVPTGVGYWCFWLGLGALAVAVVARDVVTRRTRKVA